MVLIGEVLVPDFDLMEHSVIIEIIRLLSFSLGF